MENLHSLEGITHITPDGYVLHYTCNPPEREIMDRKGIVAVGEKFNVGEREVLKIPVSLLVKYKGIDDLSDMDYESLVLLCENFLRAAG